MIFGAGMKSVGFAGLFVLLAAGAVQADSQTDVLQAMLHCSATADRGARLACYDEAVLRAPGALTRPALGAPPAPSPAASPAPQPAPVLHRERGFIGAIFGPSITRPPQTTVAQFGSESIASGGTKAYPGPLDADTLDEITARLVSYDIQGGFLVVTLDNGQVWRQVSGAPVGTLANPAASYRVTIGRGLADTYSMKLSHFGRTLAVRRIR
jgi:hypothetical protein